MPVRVPTSKGLGLRVQASFIFVRGVPPIRLSRKPVQIWKQALLVHAKAKKLSTDPGPSRAGNYDLLQNTRPGLVVQVNGMRREATGLNGNAGTDVRRFVEDD